MILRAIYMVALAVTMSGCGGQSYVRETTRTLADDVGGLQKSLARFSAAQRETASQRIDRIMKQRRQLAEGDGEIAAQIAKLKPSDAALSDALYTGALKTARDRIDKEKSLADRMVSEREALKATQTKFDADLGAQLETLASQLRDLGSMPSLKSQGQFVFDYLKSTADEVEKLEQAAKQANTKAETPTGGASR